MVGKPKGARYHVELYRLDDEEGVRMWNLDAFAAEFGHEIKRIFPIFVVLVDGELSAYYYAQPHVVIYPAVHPKHFSPRSFYEVAKTIVDASKRTFGNPLWVVDRSSQITDPELLRKIHLVPSGVDLYEVPERF
jgi:hypothetical protein